MFCYKTIALFYKRLPFTLCLKGAYKVSTLFALKMRSPFLLGASSAPEGAHSPTSLCFKEGPQEKRERKKTIQREAILMGLLFRKSQSNNSILEFPRKI